MSASGKPVFPVCVKDAAFTPPDLPAYYLVAADGLYVVRRTPLFAAAVPVAGGVPGLRAHATSLALTIGHLPPPLLERAMGFFRAVYERWGGEGILIMFYAPPAGGRAGRFAFRAPPQLVRGRMVGGRFLADLALTYGACEKPGPEFLKLGTFHSHADLAPGHSDIDVHDELYETGLHITAGYVHRRRPEFSAAFVVGQTRFPVPVGDVLPPLGGIRRPPREWMDRVVVRCEPVERGGSAPVAAGPYTRHGDVEATAPSGAPAGPARGFEWAGAGNGGRSAH